MESPQPLKIKKAALIGGPVSKLLNNSTDKQLVFEVRAVDLFGSRRKKHFESFSNASHDRCDLTCRFDDLRLDKLGRIRDLHMRPVDRLTYERDLVFGSDGRLADKLFQLGHLKLDQFGRFSKMPRRGREVRRDLVKMHRDL